MARCSLGRSPGAVAPQLEHALNTGNAKVGLLSSVALLVRAVFVLPVGLLVDRVKRIPVLSLSIVLWSVASLASAFAGSYGDLLLSRLALGGGLPTGQRAARGGDRLIVVVRLRLVAATFGRHVPRPSRTTPGGPC